MSLGPVVGRKVFISNQSYIYPKMNVRLVEKESIQPTMSVYKRLNMSAGKKQMIQGNEKETHII